MIEYDPTNARHRERMELRIKNAWFQEIGRSDTTGAGGRGRPEITAKYAKQWAEAGLDPNAPGAPRAPEGVEPLPDPEPAPAPVYTGPSSTELAEAIKAEEAKGAATLEHMQMVRNLRHAHALALRHERNQTGVADLA